MEKMNGENHETQPAHGFLLCHKICDIFRLTPAAGDVWILLFFPFLLYIFQLIIRVLPNILNSNINLQ